MHPQVCLQLLRGVPPHTVDWSTFRDTVDLVLPPQGITVVSEGILGVEVHPELRAARSAAGAAAIPAMQQRRGELLACIPPSTPTSTHGGSRQGLELEAGDGERDAGGSSAAAAQVLLQRYEARAALQLALEWLHELQHRDLGEGPGLGAVGTGIAMVWGEAAKQGRNGMQHRRGGFVDRVMPLTLHLSAYANPCTNN